MVTCIKELIKMLEIKEELNDEELYNTIIKYLKDNTEISSEEYYKLKINNKLCIFRPCKVSQTAKILRQARLYMKDGNKLIEYKFNNKKNYKLECVDSFKPDQNFVNTLKEI